MRKKIEIVVRLHPGIADPDAGTPRAHYSWTVGPRNLLRAITTYHEYKTRLRHSYGNVGMGGVWLQIAGVRLHAFDVYDITTMHDARGLIEYATSGKLESDRAMLAREQTERDREERVMQDRALID